MIQDTIRDLFTSGDLEAIITQIDILMAEHSRLIQENIGFKHEIRRLAQAFANITEPATGRTLSSKPPQNNEHPRPRQNNERPISKPDPKPKPSKDALDLDL